MDSVTVIINGQEVQISYTELPRVIAQLQLELDQLLSTETLYVEGYVSHQQCKAILSRRYPSETILRAHVGNLWGAFIALTETRELVFSVLCMLCGCRFEESTGKRRSRTGMVPCNHHHPDATWRHTSISKESILCNLGPFQQIRQPRQESLRQDYHYLVAELDI